MHRATVKQTERGGRDEEISTPAHCDANPHKARDLNAIVIEKFVGVGEPVRKVDQTEPVRMVEHTDQPGERTVILP